MNADLSANQMGAVSLISLLVSMDQANPYVGREAGSLDFNNARRFRAVKLLMLRLSSAQVKISRRPERSWERRNRTCAESCAELVEVNTRPYP